MIFNYIMDNQLIIDRILCRIDRFDDKLDENISGMRDDITDCKLDIQSVQSDLTNHLNNKKDETESFKRRIYIGSILFGVIFTTYAVIKELL